VPRRRAPLRIFDDVELTRNGWWAGVKWTRIKTVCEHLWLLRRTVGWPSNRLRVAGAEGSSAQSLETQPMAARGRETARREAQCWAHRAAKTPRAPANLTPWARSRGASRINRAGCGHGLTPWPISFGTMSRQHLQSVNGLMPYLGAPIAQRAAADSGHEACLHTHLAATTNRS